MTAEAASEGRLGARLVVASDLGAGPLSGWIEAAGFALCRSRCDALDLLVLAGSPLDPALRGALRLSQRCAVPPTILAVLPPGASESELRVLAEAGVSAVGSFAEPALVRHQLQVLSTAAQVAVPSAAASQQILERKLRRAIEERDLEMHYQPRIDARTGSITGFEALVRWTDDELGSVPPCDFVPLAERVGLINGLGRLTVGQACRQVKAWREAGLDPGLVAVNVSGKHLGDAEFPRWVLETIRGAGLSAADIELEITESCVVEGEHASEALAQLRASGLKVAIDDFGTGYSSLQYLRDLPVDRLKIDQSFIRDIEGSEAARRITSAILSLAWSLGLECVAEGVETEAQVAFLREHGCDELQGWHFSPRRTCGRSGRHAAPRPVARLEAEADAQGASPAAARNRGQSVLVEVAERLQPSLVFVADRCGARVDGCQ